MKFRRTIVTTAILAGTIGGLAACSPGTKSAERTDQNSVESQLQQYQRVQPIPRFDYSQYRQTLIDVESAEAHGVATTTFFYNQGSAKPILSCPSLGFPVASTSQLTSPEQEKSTYQNPYVIPQQEPNGAFTGDSTGTYVVCVLPNGQKQVDYWEGFVYTAGGAAHLGADGTIVEDHSTVVSGHK